MHLVELCSVKFDAHSTLHFVIDFLDCKAYNSNVCALFIDLNVHNDRGIKASYFFDIGKFASKTRHTNISNKTLEVFIQILLKFLMDLK